MAKKPEQHRYVKWGRKRNHKESSASQICVWHKRVYNRTLRRIAKRDPENAPKKLGHLGYV